MWNKKVISIMAKFFMIAFSAIIINGIAIAQTEQNTRTARQQRLQQSMKNATERQKQETVEKRSEEQVSGQHGTRTWSQGLRQRLQEATQRAAQNERQRAQERGQSKVQDTGTRYTETKQRNDIEGIESLMFSKMIVEVVFNGFTYLFLLSIIILVVAAIRKSRKGSTKEKVTDYVPSSGRNYYDDEPMTLKEQGEHEAWRARYDPSF